MKIKELVETCESRSNCFGCPCSKECDVYSDIYGYNPKYARELVKAKEQRTVFKPVTVTFDEAWLESEVGEE